MLVSPPSLGAITSSSSFRLSPIQVICTLVFTTGLLWFIYRKLYQVWIYRSFRERSYVLNQHQWRPVTGTAPRYCNVCETIAYGIRTPVVTCDICGTYAHIQCASHRVTSKAIPCRVAALESQKLQRRMQHHWIKGNIDPTDTCEVCGLFCGSILALSGMHCAWCRRRMHESCFKEAQASCSLNECDLGRHRRLILPPHSITLNTSSSLKHALNKPTPSTPRQALRRVKAAVSHTAVNLSLRLRSGTLPPPEDSDDDTEVTTEEEEDRIIPSQQYPYTIVAPKDSTPLLVFVNTRSGGQLGLSILRNFRKWLNPLQVYDLACVNPASVIGQFKHIPRLKVLVCGGDGTIRWILSALDEECNSSTRQPPVGILPLGTGNDLARVFGWGGGYHLSSAGADMDKLLCNIENAHVGLLDRWLVDLNGKKMGVMNNYLGIGVDAQVALEFHNQREAAPGLFMSQFVNKLWYSRFGAKNFFVRKCVDLCKKVSLVCDGVEVEIPESAEGIIFLNINSYGGGSTLWQEPSSEEEEDSSSSGSDDDDDDVMSSGKRKDRIYNDISSSSVPGSFSMSSCQDGLIDIAAVYGSLHLGQMQVGLSKAVRLCQGREVNVVLKEQLPIQIDGEPAIQGPCTLSIKFLKQSYMLCKTVVESDVVTTKVYDVLDWAESNNTITSDQRDILLREISKRIKERKHSLKNHHKNILSM